MNPLIKKLAKKSGATINEGFDGNRDFVYGITMSPEELERFALSLIKESLEIARVGLEYGPSMEEAVYIYFGFKEQQGWVCSKCGIDRTKEVCPKGHMAAVTGDCPMTAVAQ